MTGGGENQRKMPQNLATGPEIHHSHHQTGLIFCWGPSEAVREHILTPT
uniref:Uncharacterized protein n=1 Tax=Aotus nancymaae TaxID=37293 RepID=A0A2K5E0C3_AOTNA